MKLLMLLPIRVFTLEIIEIAQKITEIITKNNAMCVNFRSSIAIGNLTRNTLFHKIIITINIVIKRLRITIILRTI